MWFLGIGFRLLNLETGSFTHQVIFISGTGWGMAESLNQGGVCLWDELVDMEDAFKFWTFSPLCLALPRRQEKWVFSHFYICLSQYLLVLIITWWLNGDCYISVFWKCRTKRVQFWILPSGDAQEIWVSAVLCASAVTSLYAILDDLGVSRTSQRTDINTQVTESNWTLDFCDGS